MQAGYGDYSRFGGQYSPSPPPADGEFYGGQMALGAGALALSPSEHTVTDNLRPAPRLMQNSPRTAAGNGSFTIPAQHQTGPYLDASSSWPSTAVPIIVDPRVNIRSQAAAPAALTGAGAMYQATVAGVGPSWLDQEAGGVGGSPRGSQDYPRLRVGSFDYARMPPPSGMNEPGGGWAF
jgi:hypothetical protein